MSTYESLYEAGISEMPEPVGRERPLGAGLLVGSELAGELVEAHGANDPLDEELQDDPVRTQS